MDADFRTQLLKYLARDRAFLKACHSDLVPENWPDVTEQIVAHAALSFFKKHGEPIGSLLRTDTEDLAIKERLGADSKTKLKELVNLLMGTKLEMVPVKALEERVKKLKHHAFFEKAVDEILTANEKGELGASLLADIFTRANRELVSNGHVSSNYFDDLEARIERRSKTGQRIPMFLIDPLDKKIRGLGRGRLGFWLAPPGGGKGLSLCHMTTSYALQGYNALHITLEDPIELVEDRLDASMSGLPLHKLDKLPNHLRKRFDHLRQEVRGRIKIVEHLDGAWSVADMERLIDYERQRGFIPDALIIDYDEFIAPSHKYKGDSARRFEIQDTYTELKQLAAKLDLFVWTAAQTRKEAESKMIITGKDTAESYSKIRRAFIALGIGRDPNIENLHHIFVMKNRTDRMLISAKIMSDFSYALLYDAEATLAYERRSRKEDKKKGE